MAKLVFIGLLMWTAAGQVLGQYVFRPLSRAADNYQRHRRRCNYERRGYRVEWQYAPEEDMVHFTLTYEPQQAGSYWTGIGFGPYMSDMDFIQVLHERPSGRVRISDTYARWYRPPRLDRVDNVWAISRRVADNALTVHFARPMGQSEWADKSLRGCQYYLFPYSGGDASHSPLSATPVLRRHWATPERLRVCDVDVHCRRPAAYNQLDVDTEHERLAVRAEPRRYRQDAVLALGTGDKARDERERGKKMAMVSKPADLPLTVTPGAHAIDECDEARGGRAARRAGDEHWCAAYVGEYERWWRTYREGEDVGQLCELLRYVRNMCCETLVRFGCSGPR